jgi:hypothetical protein
MTMTNKLVTLEQVAKEAIKQYKQMLSPDDDEEIRKLKFISAMRLFGADRDVCNDVLKGD